MRQRLVYWLVARFYNYLATRDRDAKITFMNFGFMDLSPDSETGDWDAKDPHVRRRALYLKLVSSIGAGSWDWSQKDILEVGSGRGGGAAFLANRLTPKSYLGIDIGSRAVEFCRQMYSVAGLQFSQGNAESLHLPDASVDVVISLESSHCYPQIPKFLKEAQRVLRSDGYLLLADFRKGDGLGQLRSQLRNSALERIAEEDITSNVLAALRVDSSANLALVNQYVPWWLRWLFKPFAGVEASGMPESFASRERQYWIFVYRKP